MHPVEEKLRAAGYDPKQIKRQLVSHTRYFGGNVQNYADAIKSKLPDQLSDKETAGALQTISPALFTEHPDKQKYSFGMTGAVSKNSGMSDRTVAMLNAIGRHQEANPFTLPVAPGTKARWQIQDEEAMRAQAVTEALRQEQWDEDKRRREEDIAWREKQHKDSMGLAWARFDAENRPKTDLSAEITKVVYGGNGLQDTLEYIDALRLRGEIDPRDYEMARSFAVQQHEKRYGGVVGDIKGIEDQFRSRTDLAPDRIVDAYQPFKDVGRSAEDQLKMSELWRKAQDPGGLNLTPTDFDLIGRMLQQDPRRIAEQWSMYENQGLGEYYLKAILNDWLRGMYDEEAEPGDPRRRIDLNFEG